MEIKKIESGKIIPFKPRQTTSKTQSSNPIQTSQNQSEVIKMPNNPQYYQAINNINFQNQYIAIPAFNSNGAINLLRLHILFDDEESVTLDIDEKDSVNSFLDSEGKPDKNAIDFFTQHYKLYFQIRKERYFKNKKLLEKILNEKPRNNIRLFNPEEEIERALKQNEDTSPDEYINSLMNDIMDDNTRKTYAARYLTRIEREFAQSSITTAQEALCLLKLCKKEDGSIDTSDLDKKTEIAVLAANYCECVQGNYIKNILAASKKDNKINLDFCLGMLKLLQAGTNCEAPLLEIEIAYNIISKYINTKNYEKTIQGMVDELQNFNTTLISLS